MSRTRKPPKESPAKRLREVFYLMWVKDHEKFDEFDDYYDSKMEQLITHYKHKLKK